MAEQLPELNQHNEHAPAPQYAAAGEARYYTGIDWISLVFRLLENVHWILLTAFVFAIAVGVYEKTSVTPIYQATSKIYIAGSESTISLADLQLSTSLAVDYQETFKIWHVHEMVDERLGLDYDYSKLAGMISVNNPAGSHFLYINIQSPDPDEAKLLADTYADVVQDFIANKMELRRPQVLEKAQRPYRPVFPNIRSAVIKAFIAGLLVASAVIALIFLLDDKIRTGDDVEKATGLATLGEVYRHEMKEQAGIAAAAPGREAVNAVVINQGLTLPYEGSEAINSICSGIIFAGKNVKRIAVTSHAPGSGKTFISTHIAISMAKRGKRVLLIDGDLRKSVMISRFRIRGVKMGLAHYLSGQCSLKDAAYSTNIPGLFLIPAGEVVKTPLSLLTSAEFEQMMDVAGKEFDLVIVDTPPIGVVIDAADIAKYCDGSLLVLEYEKISKGALDHMKRTMEQSGTQVIGCVINKVSAKRIARKRYYYQYGYSGYYSGDREEKPGRARRSDKKKRESKKQRE